MGPAFAWMTRENLLIAPAVRFLHTLGSWHPELQSWRLYSWTSRDAFAGATKKRLREASVWLVPLKRRLPDPLGVGANGAVGREPAHAGDICDAGLGPNLLLPVQRVDAPLRTKIIFEIGRHHVVVGVSQCLGQLVEAMRIAGREDARRNGLDRAGKRRRGDNDFSRNPPIAAALGHLVGAQAENEDILAPDPLADF